MTIFHIGMVSQNFKERRRCDSSKHWLLNGFIRCNAKVIKLIGINFIDHLEMKMLRQSWLDLDLEPERMKLICVMYLNHCSVPSPFKQVLQ
uniref:Uncharacterized protein n=1 Tax=Octopus bimaculoides TaxID=37653 RepID=A0A0L8GWR5_OCTBM